MPSITLKLSKQSIQKMKQHYHHSILTKKIPYAIFTAKVEGCTITAYESLKVLFQGEQAEAEAFFWQPKTSSPLSKPQLVDPLDSHVGSDEVGTGDFFGPICVGATLVLKADIPYLKTLGIMDSKKLSDSMIQELAPLIKAKCLYATSLLNNTDYNKLIASGCNQGKIKALLHNDALNKVITKSGVATMPIIIDQFVHQAKYYEYLQHEPHIVDGITFLTKAEDQYLAVACGAIIARDLFLQCMDALSKKIGFDVPKGAGAHVDQFGIMLLEHYNRSVFDKIAKTHFSNMKRITDQ